MEKNHEELSSFFERPSVQIETLPIGPGIPIGIEKVFNPEIGIGGAYGSWGQSYDNTALHQLIADHLGEPLTLGEKMNLSELGFVSRHHIPKLTEQDDLDLEVEVGARFLRQAAAACHWEPSEIQGVLIGSSGPVMDDYVEQISRAAGIPESALKVSIHKACDGAVAGLNLALNPELSVNQVTDKNLAKEFFGKKILVGGIEGLSRFLKNSLDRTAIQLFGNGAGIVGVIPGQTMQLLASKSHENYDEEGVLQVKMVYPYTRHNTVQHSMLEVSTVNANHIRVAGKMHTPQNNEPIIMAGLVGMVKLFVRTGVEVVKDVYQDYQQRITEMGMLEKTLAVGIVHHANLKINKLKEKHLQREGINIALPWVLSDFGNISAASTIIALLRHLPNLKLDDHVLIDGFGAGTYYDTLVVALGRLSAIARA